MVYILLITLSIRLMFVLLKSIGYLNDQLHKIHEISPDFLSVGVSGMDNSELLLGRPFGGCAILYRKCLASCICSNRFCAVKFCDSTGFTSLMISIYMPADSGPSYYLDTWRDSIIVIMFSLLVILM